MSLYVYDPITTVTSAYVIDSISQIMVDSFNNVGETAGASSNNNIITQLSTNLVMTSPSRIIPHNLISPKHHRCN